MRGVTATLMLILIPATLAKEINIDIAINKGSANSEQSVQPEQPENPEQPELPEETEVKKPVVVFGAGTPAGLAVLRYLVDQCEDTDPKAFVIDSTKIDEKLIEKVVYGIINYDNQDDISAYVEGASSVIVALRPTKNPDQKLSLHTILEKIIEGMKTHNVEMISVVLSDYVFEADANQIPSSCQDEVKEEKKVVTVLENSSLNWLAACPRHIDTTETSDDYKTEKGKSAGPKVTANGLAKFLVTSCEGNIERRSAYGIANK